MISENSAVDQSQTPEFNYHLLRNALDRYSKNLQQLQPDEYQQVYRNAHKTYELETLVLNSEEAQRYVVAPEQIDQSLSEIAARYTSQQEFEVDMNNNGLDESTLRTALFRELTFDGVMQMVGARSIDISDLDIRLFYEMHHDRFETPEKRVARHILITVNEDFAENSAASARQKIDDIEKQLKGRSNRFPQFAKRHSECPTAMEGGKLGEVTRGQLYPELDEALFALQENEISAVVQSELGFHLLCCDKIKASKRVPLSQAAERIRGILDQRNRRSCQKNWLSELQAAQPA